MANGDRSGAYEFSAHSPVFKSSAPLTSLVREDAGRAVVLLGATLIALLWANNPFAASYRALWERDLTLGVGPWSIQGGSAPCDQRRAHGRLLVRGGLEIKREDTVGELGVPRTMHCRWWLRSAAWRYRPCSPWLSVREPRLSADGASRCPPTSPSPGSTDHVRRRLPSGLKALLLAIAIAEDVDAILIIAFAYSEGLSASWLAAALAIFALMAVVPFAGATSPWWYVLPPWQRESRRCIRARTPPSPGWPWAC